MRRYDADDNTAHATAATAVNPIGQAAPPLGAADASVDPGRDIPNEAAQIAADNDSVSLQTPEGQSHTGRSNVGSGDGGTDMPRTETESQGTGIKEDG